MCDHASKGGTMGLHLYNSLTRTKEAFVPLDPKNVRMYVCGPTVYDYAHIGNARPVIVFDVLFRLLRHTYGGQHVTYVRNITDVDDKINERAKRDGVTIRELTERTAKIYQDDARALGNLDPTHQPRVTDHMAEIVAMIGALVASGAAYEAQGHVLFHVPSKADYGKLAKRTIDDMIAGARVDVAPYKKHPMDFVLWKPSTDDQPGWASPWGRGRPGWHIECSAMSEKLLGETFDIHGGGIDLIFPHHENEIAQSECAHGGRPMARYWLHNGFLNVEGTKMSKSLGNFLTINELLRDWPGDALRFNMLKTHYRQPFDWTLKNLHESAKTMERWADAAADAPESFAPSVREALEDDLNTPKAVAALHELDGDDPERLTASLKALGFSLARVDTAVDVGLTAKVEALIAARAAARKSKNFAEADRIRGEIASLGVVLEDGPQGTTWKVGG
jgi:cysteinyl-tRNA synthetase